MRHACCLLTVLMLMPLAAAETYYVDARNGADEAAGTSGDTAWKTLARVERLELKPGDQVLLRRGCVWNEGLELRHSGDKGKPITIGAYGEGDRPVLCGLRPLAEKDWTELQPGLWGTVEGSFALDIGHLWCDAGPVGKRVTKADDLKQHWQFFHDRKTKRLVVRLKGNPARDAKGLSAAALPYALKLHHCDDITVSELDVQHFAIHGLSGYNNKRIRVEGCRFAWIGGALFGDKAVGYGNGVEFGGNALDCLVADCRFEQIYDSAITHQNWDPDGRRQRGIVFRNNRIDRCAVGIEVFSHSGTTEECTYRGNLITNCGRGWSGNGGLWAAGFRIVSTKIDFKNLRVEGNRVEGSLHCGLFLSGGEIHLDGNVIIDGDSGLYITGQNGNRPWTGTANNNVIARNRHWGVYIVDSAGRCTFTHNTIVNNGDASQWNRHNVMLDGASNSTWTWNVLASNGSMAMSINNATHRLDHNVYFRLKGSVIGWDNTKKQFALEQFDAYRKAAGQDAHSVAADPGFADAAGLDFTLPASSPCHMRDGDRSVTAGAASANAR